MKTLFLPFIAVSALAAQLAAADSVPSPVEAMMRVGRSLGSSYSPDGKWIAFNSTLNGSPQSWIIPSAGGFPRLVTSGTDSAGETFWSPTGDWIAVSFAPGGGQNTQTYLVRPDGTGMKMMTPGGKENNWLMNWDPDGKHLLINSNTGNPASMDAYILDIGTGKMELAAPSGGVGMWTNISDDLSRGLIYEITNESDDNLYLIDTVSHKKTLLTKHTPPGHFFGRISPDGKTVYMGSDKDADMAAFSKCEINASGEPGPITPMLRKPGAELKDLELNRQGTMAALIWNDNGRNTLSLVELPSGKIIAEPKLPQEVLIFAAFSPDGRQLALSMTGAAAPTDIWTLDIASGEFRQLTFSPHPGVDLAKLVRPELVKFKAHDGLELSGWLYRPSGQKGPAAYVINFHGGPQTQEVPSFSGLYQALLAQGIGVFAPNVRGSAGFGKHFVNLDNGPLRANAIRDIKSCADYLLVGGIADPKRLGIMGASYGGYMTMAGMTEYPELFAAGVDMYGIVNFDTYFKHTEKFLAVIAKAKFGDPDTQAAMLASISPINKIANIRAPLMVQHGANDTIVPVIEAEQVVESLKKRGIAVEYLLFPDEGHGFRKTANRVKSITAVTDFFRTHLKPGNTR